MIVPENLPRLDKLGNPREPLPYTDGWKYRTAYGLKHKLYNQDIEVLHPYSGQYYAIKKFHDGWYLMAKNGCSWDGASMYWDFKWIMYPSLWHDILHWLIAKGAVSERSNDLIDKELGDCIRYGVEPIRWIHGGEVSRPVRAMLIEKGTNLVDEETKQMRLKSPHDRPINWVT